MTPEGYEMIRAALAEDPEITLNGITPCPREGEDIRELTVHTQDTDRRLVFAALDVARLLFHDSGELQTGMPGAPLLTPLSATSDRVRFADQKAK